MKVNSDKSHLLMSGNKRTITSVGNTWMEAEDVLEILRMAIDSKLKFESHINKPYKSQAKKLNTLEEISNYMAVYERKIMLKAFITL